MHTTTLIIGGCRSGKSSQALLIGEKACGRRNLFVATCTPHDAEMADRITRHQKERGSHWQTVETPIALAEVFASQGPGADIVLIDCLTLWISNLMMTHTRDDDVIQHVDQLCKIIMAPPCPVIMVANEVGTGIVPENKLARRFRDLAGWCNQKTAAACNHVIWMVAGIPVDIKTNPILHRE